SPRSRASSSTRRSTCLVAPAAGASERMAARLDVGNLGSDIDARALRTCFERYGRVLSVRVVYGGHAFVTMGSTSEGTTAMEAMHGAMFDARSLSVTAAREQPPLCADVDRDVPARLVRTVRERYGI